ncbi:MAG: ABC transporter substrate-binding protein [Chloroflexi bacterium]|nr:ABC transporter substrate-binding protein [Chloroflexota bacterium]
MKHKTMFLSILLTVGTLLLDACGGAATTAAPATAPPTKPPTTVAPTAAPTAVPTPEPTSFDDGALTYAMYADVDDWDPSSSFSLGVVPLANIYETLLWYNGPGAAEQFTPGLATEWSVSSDGLTWTFKIRAGAKFHDGEPVNAAAVKYSIERTMGLGEGAAYIWGPVDSIEAPDDTTVAFHLKSPAPIDLIASSQYGAYIMSPKSAEQGKEWFNQGNDAGSGPYRLKSWEAGQQITLVRFDDYWGGWEGRHFSTILLPIVTESSTMVQMIEGGEADFASLVPVDSIPGLQQNADVEVVIAPSWKNSMFLINTQKPPTDNVKFRQALAYAWDYEKVVNDVYNGMAEAALGPIPKTMWGHDDKLTPYTFDLDKAKALLEESGVPSSEWKITAQYIGTSKGYENSLLLFQSNLAKIGVTLELAPGPWTTIWANARNLETAPNLQSMTWWPTYPTPNDWLIGMFHTEEKALFNLSHYSNPEVDALIDEGMAVEGADRAKAIANYGKVQQILMDDAVAIFYADVKTALPTRKSVTGFTPNPAYETVFFYNLSRVQP